MSDWIQAAKTALGKNNRGQAHGVVFAALVDGMTDDQLTEMLQSDQLKPIFEEYDVEIPEDRAGISAESGEWSDEMVSALLKAIENA